LKVRVFHNHKRDTKRMENRRGVRERIYPQSHSTSVNMWISHAYVGIVFIYNVTVYEKSKQMS